MLRFRGGLQKACFNFVKCDHSVNKIRKNFARTCSKCRHTETASANTLFHKVKFGLRKAANYCISGSVRLRCVQLRGPYLTQAYHDP